MKKGKVCVIAIGHKNGTGILYDGDVVTENDVDNFDELVKSGKIKVEAKKEIHKEIKNSTPVKQNPVAKRTNVK